MKTSIFLVLLLTLLYVIVRSVHLDPLSFFLGAVTLVVLIVVGLAMTPRWFKNT
jgi:uncharacterized membrane protein YccC